MCTYCGCQLDDDHIEMIYEDDVIHLCDEECAIFYMQEQQQTHFQTWVKFR